MSTEPEKNKSVGSGENLSKLQKDNAALMLDRDALLAKLDLAEKARNELLQQQEEMRKALELERQGRQAAEQASGHLSAAARSPVVIPRALVNFIGNETVYASDGQPDKDANGTMKVQRKVAIAKGAPMPFDPRKGIPAAYFGIKQGNHWDLA